MTTSRIHHARRWGCGLLLVLGLAASSSANAGSERVFANGFEPCCRIGGLISGLSGSGLVLNLSAEAINENRSINANGLYLFVASVASGTAYTITLDSEPSGQACGLANASGTMGSGDIENVNVSCGASPDLIWDQGVWGQDWQ